MLTKENIVFSTLKLLVWLSKVSFIVCNSSILTFCTTAILVGKNQLFFQENALLLSWSTWRGFIALPMNDVASYCYPRHCTMSVKDVCDKETRKQVHC